MHLYLVHSTLCTMHSTRKNILDIISNGGRVRPRELYEKLDVKPRAIFKQLKSLLEDGLVEKVGIPPNVFYSPVQNRISTVNKIDAESTKIINDNFYLIDTNGNQVSGQSAFISWCEQRNLPVEKTAKEYVTSFNKFTSYKNKNGLIDGTSKIKNTFEKCYLDNLYYLDFYNIERFGKTKLGQMLLYAKQSQNRKLIKNLNIEIKPKIELLAKDFDAVCYIPPTISRGVQLMKELERELGLRIPVVEVTKIRGQISIAQKTLSRLEDRIKNAKASLVVENTRNLGKVLIIDDAVGSGASMNEVAKQIKERGMAKKVIGLSITGSFKGFHVINEV